MQLRKRCKSRRRAFVQTKATRQSHAPATRSIIQTALKIGHSNDVYEQQADRVANQVMAGKRQESISPVETMTQTKCEDCEEDEMLQTKSKGEQSSHAPSSQVHQIIRQSGQPIPYATRTKMEARFKTPFSNVKIHNDNLAHQSAQSLNAKAYTIGEHVIFNDTYYQPNTTQGQWLLAHELTHVIQQSNQNTQLQRACLPSSQCGGVIAGSAESFGDSQEDEERGPRARRRRMTCNRATGTSHAGRARQLEIFMNSQSPSSISQIHGVFIDADLGSFTGAMVTDCNDWRQDALPNGCDPHSFAGATKPCVLIPGELNQQAYRFNQGDTQINGQPRDEWRVDTFQLLTHEVQHVVFDNSSRPAPPGTSACPRNRIQAELTELNAILSEFPIIFRAVPSTPGPARTRAITRLNNWFHDSITNPFESIAGTVKAMRCECDCAEVNAHIRDIFNLVSSSWSTAEKNAFNSHLRQSRWNAAPHQLNWPL